MSTQGTNGFVTDDIEDAALCIKLEVHDYNRDGQCAEFAVNSNTVE